MSKLRRYNAPYQIYFVTAVTHRRIPILIAQQSLFRESMRRVMARQRVRVWAWVLLPDHFHMLLDPGPLDLSRLMQKLKLSFATQYLRSQGTTRGRVWQRRFWDHVIRDQNDLKRHIDYVHYNPVKHGLVPTPFAWNHSSARHYLAYGHYNPDWGQREPAQPGMKCGE